MCRLSGVSRNNLRRRQRPQSEWESSARSAVREVALEFPAYGYRRVLAELKRRGWQVGERRVRRWMREQDLSRPRQHAWKRTTDSNHTLPVYPNLARTLTLNAPDQLWAADITYVRLLRDFIYAAVILDVFSRRAVGWAVETHAAHRAATGGAGAGITRTPTCPLFRGLTKRPHCSLTLPIELHLILEGPL